MFQNNKHNFWQAFFVAVLIFLLGLVIGVYVEQIRVDTSIANSYDSEISLFDVVAWTDLIDSSQMSSKELVDANLEFADRIYYEALELEQFDESNQITNSLKQVHRKYDLLRTILWMNTLKLKQRNIQINDVVYFYIYDTEDVGIKSKQIVFSRVLNDLKQKQGNNIVLIPIAVDSELSSLDYLLEEYNVNDFPSVLINEKELIVDVPSVQEIEQYLD